jgi:hypothetical protein
MNTRKIKIAYPKYSVNRLKNVVKVDHLSRTISYLIGIQNDRHNGIDQSWIRKDVVEPGAWSLHFDGKDFWFEGSDQTIQNEQLEDLKT